MTTVGCYFRWLIVAGCTEILQANTLCASLQNKFTLVEVYKDSEEAPAAHKGTQHYATWRDTVADMMEVRERGWNAKYGGTPSRWRVER